MFYICLNFIIACFYLSASFQEDSLKGQKDGTIALTGVVALG